MTTREINRNSKADGAAISGSASPSMQELLDRAAEGDLNAAAQMFGYLTASLHDLRQIMQTAVHESSNVRLWRNLLSYYAVGEWGDWDPFSDSSSPRQRRLSWKEPVSGSASQAITELFVIDQTENETKRKQILLHRALHGPGPLRFAAACLLGLRSDPEAIPILEDMICGGGDPAQAANEAWKLRAVEALAALGDQRCAPALLCALTSGQGPLHQAAARALRELGPKAEDILLLAMLHPDSHIRWHAAHALGQIGNLHGLETLVEGLCDEHQAVRWATSTVLANLDCPAIPFILKFMLQHRLDESLRQSVYHALHAMNSQSAREYLKPLLEVLRSPTASYQAPVLAQKMLAEWKSSQCTNEAG